MSTLGKKKTGIFISSRDRGSCWGVSVGRPSSKATKKIEVVGKRFQLAPPSASGFLLLQLGLDGFRKIETTSDPKYGQNEREGDFSASAKGKPVQNARKIVARFSSQHLLTDLGRFVQKNFQQTHKKGIFGLKHSGKKIGSSGHGPKRGSDPSSSPIQIKRHPRTLGGWGKSRKNTCWVQQHNNLQWLPARNLDTMHLSRDGT